jgi:hypothetical protein
MTAISGVLNENTTESNGFRQPEDPTGHVSDPLLGN